MTTRLSQRKIKGSDVAYPNLQEEIKARFLHGEGTGTGYIVPAGGIPRADLHESIQLTLSRIEKSLLIGLDGVTKADLVSSLQDTVNKAETAYQKPAAGIDETDLTEAIRNKLSLYDNFYVYPSTGIPRVDMDAKVQEILGLAESAYQKPSGGIGISDFTHEVKTILADVPTYYKKPATGIPKEDIEADYVERAESQKYDAHIEDSSVHIVEHDKLQGVGRYGHEVIDDAIDEYKLNLQSITKELDHARDDFLSLGNRFDSLLGLNSAYRVDTKEEWHEGRFQHLQVSEDGFVGLVYKPETPVIEVFDTEKTDRFSPETKLADLYFESDSRLLLGSKPWIHTTNRSANVGVRVKMFVYADVTGVYEFATQFTGNMKLSIGGQLLFDTQGVYNQVDTYTRTAQMKLEAGRLYSFVFEGWYGTSGSRIISFTWQKPDSHYHCEIPRSHISINDHNQRHGTYTSQVIDLKDNQISKWLIELEASENRTPEDVVVSVRASTDNQVFTEWTMVDLTKAIALTPARYVQVKIDVYKHFDFYTPIVTGYAIRMISSAYNELMDELIHARTGFLTLEERFNFIDQKLQEISKLKETQGNIPFHPEYFASIRLAAQELNTLRLLLLESKRQARFILLDNGVVDPLKTVHFLDEERSDPFETTSNGIRSKKQQTRFSTNEDWSKWTLEDLEISNNQLRLATSTVDPLSNSITFSNSNRWSSQLSTYLGYNYQAYIAQPFYTSANVNLITQLEFYRQGASGGDVSISILVCPTRTDRDAPDIEKPIYYQGNGTSSYFSFSNLRIRVDPNTKYWLVLKRESYALSSYITYFFLRPLDSSSHVRLRGTNPKKETLPLRYSADANGQVGWLTDSGYCLNFYMTEALAFVPEGKGHQIIDYQKKSTFVQEESIIEKSTDGLAFFTYQGSDDAIDWSEETTDITKVPLSRFLKCNLFIKKASSTAGSPYITQLDVYHVINNGKLLTKPITLRHVPTHALFYGDYDEGVTFHLSRDDGRSFIPLKEHEYTQLTDVTVGMDIRLMMEFNEERPLDCIREYGFIAVTYQDITQQNVTALYESHIATDNQTVFTLDDRYLTGTHSLQVYVNGIRQSIIADYLETDNYHITFTEPLVGGPEPDIVTFIVAAGVYNEHDVIQHARLDEMEWQIGEVSTPHEKTHVYNEAGQLIETQYSHGYYIKKMEYTYDTAGRKASETTTTTRYVRTVTYEYDEHGFLLKEAIAINGVSK